MSVLHRYPSKTSALAKADPLGSAASSAAGQSLNMTLSTVGNVPAPKSAVTP